MAVDTQSQIPQPISRRCIQQRSPPAVSTNLRLVAQEAELTPQDEAESLSDNQVTVPTPFVPPRATLTLSPRTSDYSRRREYLRRVDG